MESHPIHHLIREVAETGRRPTDVEVQRLREHIAQAGFHPLSLARGGGRVAGLSWRGRALRGSDPLTTAEVHYLWHVVRRREWPPGVELEAYLQSARDVVLDPTSGVFLSRYEGQLQVGLIGASGALRGPGGRSSVLIEYRVELGHWVTAFQIELADLSPPRRSEFRWLLMPT